MKKGSHYDNARSIVALLIVLIAFAIFLLFYYNSDEIMASNNFYLFMTLATLGMGLLIGLMYLANNSQHPQAKAPSHKTVAPKASKAKSKKKKK